MIPGILAQRRRAAAAVQRLVFPLTYDELDSTNTLSLTRVGGAGPHVTPSGFEGDGFGARYTYTSLPAWVNSGRLSLQGTISVPNVRLGSTREDILGLVTNNANAFPRLGFSVIADDKGAVQGMIAARCYSGGAVQSLPMGRPGWRYDRRTPDVTVRGLSCKPQAIIFMDSNTYAMSVHVDDTESIFYKVRASDGEVLASFSFGLVTYRHVATIARRANGDVWVTEYETGKMLRIDLDASFASGTAVILQTLDTSSIFGVGAIDFMTIAGTEYLLLQQYDNVEANGYLYFFPVSAIGGTTLVEGSRYKRFLLGRRIQGIVVRGANLLVARNNLYGATSPTGVIGWVQEFDITAAANTLADGSTIHAGNNASYILNQWYGPAAYVEDLAIHPSNGRLFTMTEGAYAVADYPGFFGVWSWDFTTAGATNHYTAEFNGAGTVSLKLNGYAFASAVWTPSQTAAALAIGGPPAATAGFGNGYTFATVANVLVQDAAVSAADYAAAVSGSYEANALTVYTLPLTNPGAETGDTTGWTPESGGMTVRSSNPLPYAGSFFFTGGSFVSSVSRQRVALSAASVAAGDVDGGQMWAKIRWQQAAYDNNDPGGMGVRTLNAANTTTGTTYSPLAWVLGGLGASGGASGWYPRCYPVALPTGTRTVDALYNASGRTAGTANDHYVDAISVTLYKP